MVFTVFTIASRDADDQERDTSGLAEPSSAMKAWLRHDSALRVMGAVAGLALLVYGAASFSKPHYSYFLTFALTGPLEGNLEARIELDDGVLVAPVVARRDNNVLRIVALPNRTIRGLGLNLTSGSGNGIIRDVQVIKAAAPVRRLSTIDLNSVGSLYRTIGLDTLAATEGLRVSERATDHLVFQIVPGAIRATLDFKLHGPMVLLRDMQITWLARLGGIVVIGGAALWLLSRRPIWLPFDSGPRVARLFERRGATTAACALWAAATFSVYFVYAGRLAIFGWNITEFIIANHLEDYGRYALGATYPTAIWRPVGPTFLVLAVDALARDPLLTYQLLSAAAVTSLTVSTYLLNRALFGHLIAHAGAALAFATPAVTLSLLNHTHSLSHLCFLLVASPTLLASAIGIVAVWGGEMRPSRWLWLAGTGWGACYLCRPESMFMAAAFFVVIVILIAKRRRSLRLLAPFMSFVAVFAAFNIWASASATRDDLSSRNTIHQFYASQAWVDVFDRRNLAPTSDVELEGYVRAMQLYGTPTENSESLTKAIARNPAAFAGRVVHNIAQLAGLLGRGQFLSFDLLLLLLVLPLGFTFLEPPFRFLAIFAAAAFSVAGVFTIFHIDDRYITIVVPAALLLGSLGAYGLNRLPLPMRLWPNALAGLVLAVALLRLPSHFDALSEAFEPERLDLSLFREMGDKFRSVVRLASGDAVPMIVHVDVPLPAAPKFNSTSLLFPYFARTSLLLAGSSELYPRDQLFSLPQCAATHLIVPAASIGGGHGEKLGTFFVPEIGDLAVFQLPAPDKSAEGSFASRFCPRRAGG